MKVFSPLTRNSDGADPFRPGRGLVYEQTSVATLNLDVDVYDIARLTAQGQALTVAAPTGTPSTGQRLTYLIEDDGTKRSFTFNSAYQGGKFPMPTGTFPYQQLKMVFEYEASETAWLLVELDSQVTSFPTVTDEGTIPAIKGQYHNGYPGTTSGQTITFSSQAGYTPVENDIVFVVITNANQSGTANRITLTSTGYTQHRNASVNGSLDDLHYMVLSKRMGSTPDTTFQFTPAAAANEGATIHIFILSGVNTTTALDVAFAYTEDTDGAIPPFAGKTIQPVTDNSFCFSFALLGGDNNPSSLSLIPTNFNTQAGSQTYDCSSVIGWGLANAGVTFNPGNVDWTSGINPESFVTGAIAFRPNPPTAGGNTSGEAARQTIDTAYGLTPLVAAGVTTELEITGQDQNLSMVTPVGSPHDGQVLLLSIIDDGARHDITWDSGYVDDAIVLPATTSGNQRQKLVIALTYNDSRAQWLATDWWQVGISATLGTTADPSYEGYWEASHTASSWTAALNFSSGWTGTAPTEGSYVVMALAMGWTTVATWLENELADWDILSYIEYAPGTKGGTFIVAGRFVPAGGLPNLSLVANSDSSTGVETFLCKVHSYSGVVDVQQVVSRYVDSANNASNNFVPPVTAEEIYDILLGVHMGIAGDTAFVDGSAEWTNFDSSASGLHSGNYSTIAIGHIALTLDTQKAPVALTTWAETSAPFVGVSVVLSGQTTGPTTEKNVWNAPGTRTVRPVLTGPFTQFVVRNADAAITIGEPIGPKVDGSILSVIVQDDGTSRNISLPESIFFSGTLALPGATSGTGDYEQLNFVYDALDDQWRNV